MSEELIDSTSKTIKIQTKDLLPLIVVIMTALLALISGFLLAGREFRSDIQLQNQNYILELRKGAYDNFIDGQVSLVESQRLADDGLLSESEKLRQEYNFQTKSALRQIAIFSTKQVNEALADHFITTFKYLPCRGNRQQWLREAKIYQSMRQEVLGNGRDQEVDDNTLLIMIFMCTLPE